MDISPLYKVTNLGWTTDGIVRHKLDIPDTLDFLTNSGDYYPVVPDLQRCRLSKGIMLCNFKDSTSDHDSQCLEKKT